MESASQPDDLMRLMDLLKTTLPSLPGFQSLSLFGSLAEGRADACSDIDMIVTTNDFARARTEVLSLLDQVGPMEFCWAISLRPDEWNPTIVFRDHGYYHKLDLGLVAADATAPSIPADQTIELINEPRPAATAAESSAVYAPERQSAGHFLLSQFLGGSRYLKARKRGQSMTCYRFAVAAADWCARAMYDRILGQPSLSGKLSTTEYVALDSLAASQHAEFLESLDFSTPAAMDRGMHSLLCQLSEHAKALALIKGEIIPEAVVQRFLAFVGSEVAKEVTRNGS